MNAEALSVSLLLVVVLDLVLTPLSEAAPAARALRAAAAQYNAQPIKISFDPDLQSISGE